ncbi:hypothetical protein [Chromohalobacter sp. 296-RDG]|uniref:hypothetical protein n=1 Tax=Chromohalobacter sp. 296-RDG TaxID=2994062 RepID=UPI0024697547|nr:hypothetical protein [Chromohalobacter sp. 296-RDG]
MNTLWKLVAWIVSRRPVADWLIKRSQRTPYFHLVKDGNTYMRRWWLFNPYDQESRKPQHRWCPISVRVHHISQQDDDRLLHDRPWNARTIILHGSYLEEKPTGVDGRHPERGHRVSRHTVSVLRQRGDTAPIGYGKFHRIHTVSKGGVYTLFISGKYRGTWGFLVDGVKVPWREYLGIREPATDPTYEQLCQRNKELEDDKAELSELLHQAEEKLTQEQRSHSILRENFSSDVQSAVMRARKDWAAQSSPWVRAKWQAEVLAETAAIFRKGPVHAEFIIEYMEGEARKLRRQAEEKS